MSSSDKILCSDGDVKHIGESAQFPLFPVVGHRVEMRNSDTKSRVWRKRSNVFLLFFYEKIMGEEEPFRFKGDVWTISSSCDSGVAYGGTESSEAEVEERY